MTLEDLGGKYPKDTIGYHHSMSTALFGPDSRPTKWLEEKAKESPNGMHETVIAHETQVVHLLGQMYLQDSPVKPF